MELNEQPYVAGEMKAIFFENPSNFYKVILLEIEECNFKTEKDEIVITGNFGEITTDTHYRFVGNVINHPRYGTQFQAISYEREKPTGKNGLIGYLSSDRFPGIGKRTAEKIVEHFGENTIDAILDDPDSLAAISGLTKQKQELIHDVLQQSQGTEKTLIELANYGFSNNMAATIMNFYKTETLKTIRENPYQLVEDIEGMGFRTADRLAEDLGFPADDKNRIKGALLATVNELCLSNGDTYVESEELMTRALQLLESSRRFIIEDSQLIEALVEMVQDMKIIEDQKRFALPSLYFSEEGIAGSLDRLLNKKQAIEYPGVDLEKEIHKMQKELGITYDAVQAHAITQAISSAFFILTGGPGTGKTTVLNGIVKLFCELNGLPANPLEYHEGIFPIIMAAPTGRAAKRMNEMTGIQSSTIHRLLGLTGQENPNEDVYTAELEGKLLIIDEASMIDTWLLHRLLKSIPPGMQVIIVGDKDQLPSVGPGQVLHDLLASAVIPQIELEQIYRQAGGSSIIPLAHDIKNGKLPADFNINQSDRSYFPCQAAQIEPLIRIVVEKAKAKGFTSKDIQILAPMYKGPAGINALNTMMQEILNPNTDNKRREVKHFDFVYRVGDKVLQLVNQPELNVFNGDIGEITSIQFAKETEDKVDEITVLFDATEVTYKKMDWNKFTLAYCCSIHKAQGSEFNMVILPMVKQYGRMLRRNLLYTAITRSKNKLILCGDEGAFRFATENAGDLRRTMLVEKLLRNSESDKIIFTVDEPKAVEPSKPKNFTLSIDMVLGQEINPMIGMEGVTPYQFMK